MENTATDDINPKHPFYLRGKFYLYLVVGSILTLFISLLISIVALRWVNPPTTSFMQQQDWESLPAEQYNLREHWVDFENLPRHSTWAVVASEDQHFWNHWGFDFESIGEAWEDRREGIRSRGASTISQQVAKNLYLWSAESFFRKGIEAGITVLIELFWPKERIIEVYLNIAEFGPGVFGIGKASEQFFGLPASELEPDMSARLAAVLPSPKRMRVNPPSPYANKRSRWILEQMTHLSGIAYVQVDSISLSESAPGLNPEDSSTIADTLLRPQPIDTFPLTSDTLDIGQSVDDQIITDSLRNDTIPDSTPPL
ncbi:monofunctional biosynthetic peptidoglycan transglycosylase [Rhodohalobacter sp. 8-1]|uniref:monofunctional biosynthetic peptidoglycan transglycosylase n=1 Tax=Rhodohalobacter sp. 8-1 TaxID=3131972 RepID=UPI0030EBC445